MLELREKVAACCQILYVEGHADMNLGHPSGREPGASTIWLKPRGPGLEEVRADDLIELDLDGNKVSGEGHAPREWPLHTEIYRARPDVNAVIHTHPLWTVVFGITGLPFRFVNQDSVMFCEALRTYSGTAELIATRELGQDLALALEDGQVLLLPNHGVVVVGSSIDEALVVALNLEKSLQAQLLAEAYGGIRNLIEKPVANRMGEHFHANGGRMDEIFGYYARKARRILAAGGPCTDLTPTLPTAFSSR